MIPTATATGELRSIPTTIIRGGTSKGVFLLESDLPEDRSQWGAYLIALFGARDITQIDGLGGNRPTTSKCCIIGPSSHPEADVDYTFAQVGIGEARVYWDFNCGNLTPAVGTFALLAGLVEAEPGMTKVRVHQTNTHMLLAVHVPTDDNGAPIMEGSFEVAGVTGTAAPVLTDFSAAVGASLGGGLFPTGERKNVITVPEIGEVECSILDLANMCVFFRADQAGLTGFEMPERGPEVVPTMHAIRQAAQRLLGIDPSKTTPWPTSVMPPRAYTKMDGGALSEGAYDLAVRFGGIQPMRDTMHEALPGTASSCAAVAAVTPGTVPYECAERSPESELVRFGHPSGVMPVQARISDVDGEVTVEMVGVTRTVRPLLRGEAYVRVADLEELGNVLAADDPTRVGVPVTA
jgi:2-methylaconitate cis-trans-isomerase PrpF